MQQDTEQREQAANQKLIVADIRLKNATSSKLLLSEQPFQALLVGLEAGYQLKQLAKPRKALNPDHSIQLATAVMLQQAMYHVQERNHLEKHQSAVNSVSFSPDGKTLASASVDNTVKLWNFDLDRLMAVGCDWVHAYLTSNPNVSDSQKQACGITSKK